MTGHLACSNAIDLGDAGAAINVSTVVGTAGAITLKAGDADNNSNIDNADATVIGANMGANPGDDKDINGDATVNVLDLVHVGRSVAGLAAGTHVTIDLLNVDLARTDVFANHHHKYSLASGFYPH